MRNFFGEQGRTKVFVEAYTEYAADGNPRRTLLIGKRAIYGWKLVYNLYNSHCPNPLTGTNLVLFV